MNIVLADIEKEALDSATQHFEDGQANVFG